MSKPRSITVESARALLGLFERHRKNNDMPSRYLHNASHYARELETDVSGRKGDEFLSEQGVTAYGQLDLTLREGRSVYSNQVTESG